jgi:hypothetical protein
MTTITARQDTYFKKSVSQAALLDDEDIFRVTAGDQFRVKAVNPKVTNMHQFLTLADPLGPKGFNSWYFYVPHWNIVEDKHPTNTDEPVSIGFTPDLYTLPGLGSLALSNKIPGSQYFTVGEATKNGTRLWTHPNTGKRVIKIAGLLDGVRKVFNQPITVTSWYRDPATNRRVGGASQSRHLQGDAVDFIVQGIHPMEVYAQLRKTYSGGGLASSNSFTHMDARGYFCTWSY